MPENDINAIAIRPAEMKVMPSPLRPLGASEYFIFSVIPAKATIASIQPKPAPKPYTTDSPKLYSRCAINETAPKIAQFTVISGR